MNEHDDTTPAAAAETSDTAKVDPAAILQSIADDEKRAEEALSPDTPLLFIVWGAAWVIGFVAFYLAFVPAEAPVLPFLAAAIVGGGALVAAIVISTVHSTRRSIGSRGPSTVQGAIYGNIFPVAFAFMGLLGWKLTSTGLGLDVMLTYWVAAPCLIVGILFLAAAAMWNDRSQLVFGIWVFVVGFVSIALPTPHNLLAGAAGGLGFLLLAAVQAARPSLTSGPIVRTIDG